jgi:hypothetical protein
MRRPKTIDKQTATEPANPPAALPGLPPAAQATLTLEGLYQRRANLKAQQEQYIANVNAVLGGLQVCEQLIAQLEAAAPTAQAST